ncbi:MAG: hypothetical protein M3380_13155 [Chloroflexota bacterium]|nr:hypothetical protein [Chloroflexota bacterium]
MPRAPLEFVALVIGQRYTVHEEQHTKSYELWPPIYLGEELGGKATVEGFGRLEVCNASFVVSYDRKAVEAVILKLIDLGQYHIADALRACKKESARPGTLRILREIAI